MISVLLPSRGRAELLARSAGSLKDTAVQAPEILVAADDDDPATVRAARQLGARVQVCQRVMRGCTCTISSLRLSQRVTGC
jgi:DNA-binding NarL/FixJ family response regulator